MDYISLLVAVGIIAIYILNDQLRKGSIKKTHAHLSEKFITDLPPDRTFIAIMAFATQKGYHIDDLDEQHFEAILNEKMTWNNYGAFYSINVRKQAGRTMVEVGIASKLGKVFLISPFIKRPVTLRLEGMLNAVKGAVFAYDNK